MPLGPLSAIQTAEDPCCEHMMKTQKNDPPSSRATQIQS